MITMLVADDENIIRDGIVTGFRWSDIGISEVYQAHNGAVAVEVAKEKMPNIIIMDIKMPKLSGIEAAKQILEFNPNAKILILSGYDSFEYAKKGIELKIEQYLLKPIDMENIVEVIKSLINKIQVEKEISNKNNLLDKLFVDNFEMLKNQNLISILNGEIVKNDFNIIQKMFNINFDNKDGVVAVIKLIDYKNNPQWDYLKDRMLINFAIQNITSEILTNKYKCEVFQNANQEIVILANIADEEVFENDVKNIEKVVEDALSISIISGAGNVFADICDISISYFNAINVIENSIKNIWMNTSNLRSIILDSMEFIKNNLNNDVSLKTVADFVHMSPNYFTSVFKQETSMTFSEYVCGEKIKKAKEYLADRDRKTYEVAVELGYIDARYFSQFFKKVTGMTPSEYREHLRK